MDGYIFTALYFQLGGVAAKFFLCKRKWHIYTELFFFWFVLKIWLDLLLLLLLLRLYFIYKFWFEKRLLFRYGFQIMVH
jgi:hypothetical protein